MNYRTLGKTNWQVSEVSFGAWAIGGSWGEVSDEDSMRALNKAVDEGINLFDTADVIRRRTERTPPRQAQTRALGNALHSDQSGQALRPPHRRRAITART